jgi:hypothetical protein
MSIRHSDGERLRARNASELPEVLPRPPSLDELERCPRCGHWLVRVKGFGARDPFVIERLSIWEHHGHQYTFAPAREEGREYVPHNCAPKPAEPAR